MRRGLREERKTVLRSVWIEEGRKPRMVELHGATMYAAAFSHGGERGRAESTREEGKVRDECLGIYPSALGARDAQHRRWDTSSRMAATSGTRVTPLKHFVEQVARVEVAIVGGNFGPAVDRIRRWIKNEVCSTQPTLQL